MAFRYTTFGSKILDTPAAAHAELVGLFKKHDRSVTAVAKELGVTTVTLWRWVSRLVELGYKNPAGDKRRGRGKDLKPRGKSKASAVR